MNIVFPSTCVNHSQETSHSHDNRLDGPSDDEVRISTISFPTDLKGFLKFPAYRSPPDEFLYPREARVPSQEIANKVPGSGKSDILGKALPSGRNRGVVDLSPDEICFIAAKRDIREMGRHREVFYSQNHERAGEIRSAYAWVLLRIQDGRFPISSTRMKQVFPEFRLVWERHDEWDTTVHSLGKVLFPKEEIEKIHRSMRTLQNAVMEVHGMVKTTINLSTRCEMTQSTSAAQSPVVERSESPDYDFDTSKQVPAAQSPVVEMSESPDYDFDTSKQILATQSPVVKRSESPDYDFDTSKQVPAAQSPVVERSE